MGVDIPSMQRRAMGPENEDQPVAALVAAAAQGDEEAWGALIDRFAGLVSFVIQSYNLGAADATNVSQTTWLRLVENIDRIQKPEQVAAWLVAAAERECLRLLRQYPERTLGGPPTENKVGGEAEELATPAGISLPTPEAAVSLLGEGSFPGANLGLTRRELEVLRLVALGRTNREVATTLFISEKTAGEHLSNILRKLDLRTRVEATAFAHRVGLLALPEGYKSDRGGVGDYLRRVLGP
jgi:RNA polymerase sigma factor (sigma-70 family)